MGPHGFGTLVTDPAEISGKEKIAALTCTRAVGYSEIDHLHSWHRFS